MAVVIGTSAGFVSATPTADPDGSASTLDQNTYGNKHTFPSEGAGAITELGFYCPYSQYNNVQYDIGIYTHDSTDNKPDVAVHISAGQSSGTGGGWKTVTGLNVSLTPGGTYWLVLEMDASVGTTQLDRSADAAQRQVTVYNLTALPDPWNDIGSSSDGYIYAIYAKYAPGGPKIPVLMNQYRQRR